MSLLAEEKFILKEGVGRIDLSVSSKGVFALYIDGKPFVLNRHDGGGSIGQELLYKVGEDAEEKTRFFRRIVEGKFDLSKPLASQLKPILDLFANGEYIIRAWEIPYGYSGGIDWELSKPLYSGFYEYYPADFDLVSTCPWEFFDFEAGDQWIKRIKAGERPWIVTTSTQSSPLFVLDGHHKIYGYGWSQIPKRLINIECITPKQNDLTPFTIV
jgi:hypothetical protein